MNLYKALPYCLLLSVFAGPVSGATPKRQDNPRGENPEIRRVAIEALGQRDGAVVVVDPARGRILAAVNQQIAFSEGFQPCSTFKLAVALVALEDGVISLETEIQVTRRTSITLTEAMALSNNTFFAKAGEQLGFQRIQNYARRLGFGEKAGWYVPGERAGTFAARPPQRGVGYMSSHGKGIKATPLQMAAFASTLANGGTLYYLQYARNKEELAKFQPRIKRRLLISKHLTHLKTAMAATVLYGTGSSAYDPNHIIYGKTGTCREGRTWLGWFVSYSDGHLPRYAVVVFLRRVGRRVTGPQAARISGKIYRQLYERDLKSRKLSAAQSEAGGATVRAGFFPRSTKNGN